MNVNDINDQVVVAAQHGIPGAAVVGTLFGWFPQGAALIAMVWYCIQIYESKSFQHWKANFLFKRNARALAKLHAKEKEMQAKIAALEIVRQANAVAANMVATAKSEGASNVVTETNAVLADKIQRDLRKAE